MFDRNTGRRLHPFDFRALAFERHGFIAKETAALIRKLAHLKAAHFELLHVFSLFNPDIDGPAI